MPPTEQQIQAYLSLLRPHPTVPADSTCPICLDPYEVYDDNQDTDYPASPSLHRPDSLCRHVFGRICIETHIRSGQRYSTRCPTCREQWIGWQASVEDHFEVDEDPLSRAITRHMRESLGSDEDEGELAVSGLSTVPLRARIIEHRPGFSVTDRVNRSIGLLERMQAIYRLQIVDADELACVFDVESAVERLWQRLDERNQGD